jgi:hypothetical protein
MCWSVKVQPIYQSARSASLFFCMQLYTGIRVWLLAGVFPKCGIISTIKQFIAIKTRSNFAILRSGIWVNYKKRHKTSIPDRMKSWHLFASILNDFSKKRFYNNHDKA